ncbi:hypothetical protein ACN4EE_17020 [Geminocystis sp. CENA526]|uniref:hypothetical protein n=1 Tax=Geminocystis sp. CENA526 TaxID=1355871 RepID=UPI003D6EFD93
MKKIFPESSSNEPKFYSGEVKLPENNKTYKYVAIRFLDPEGKKDKSNRIIPHEIALLGEDSLDYSDFESFHLAIWEKYLAPIYKDVYKYEIKEIESIQIQFNSDYSHKIVDKPNKSQELIKEGKTTEKKSLNLSLLLMMGIIIIALLIYLIIQKNSDKTPSPQNQSQQIQIPVEKVLENNSPPQTIPSTPKDVNKTQSETIQKNLNNKEKSITPTLMEYQILEIEKQSKEEQINTIQEN